MSPVKLPLVDRKHIRTPPPWVQQAYLTLVDRFAGKREPRRWVFAKQLPEVLAMSQGSARRFVHEATKAHLAVRVYAGTYVLVQPSTALRLGALPLYWAELVAFNDAMNQSAYTNWAFACVTASMRTDYAPERPWLVTHPEQPDDSPWKLFAEVDRFAYRHKSPSAITVSFLEWDAKIPILSPEETALILASTRMPREANAATKLLETANLKVTKDLARHLNFFGLHTREDVGSWENPGIRVPAFIEERQKRLGQQILKSRGV